MPLAAIIRLVLLRAVVIVIFLVAIYIGIATIDYLFGTNAIAVIWQWLARAWQLFVRWLQIGGRLALRWMPGFAKRFLFRKSMSGIWKIITTAALAGLFAWLGGRKYDEVLKRVETGKESSKATLSRLWNTEIRFFPKWLRAGLFVAASGLAILGFIEIQNWAVDRNSPKFLGIDPWSFTFGFIASFFLTNLPLIGFDHFLSVVFKPLQHKYRGFIRRKGFFYAVVNWLMALRPARRRAELERRLYMRKWKKTQGEKSFAEVRHRNDDREDVLDE